MNTKYIKLLSGLIMLFFAFLSVQAQTQTPGGATNVSFSVWLTPASYSNGVWTNLAVGGIGDFTQPTNWSNRTPATLVDGLNFHSSVRFQRTSNSVAPHRMRSENNMNVVAAESFTFILVLRAQNGAIGNNNTNILTYSNNDPYVRSGGLGFVNSGSDALSIGWPPGTSTAANARGIGNLPWATSMLLTIDNNNTGANGIRRYTNGAQVNTATSANSSMTTNPLILGSSSQNIVSGGTYAANSDIQEVILLKRTDRTTTPFLTDAGNDFQKIHSYLAVKYGITLNNTDNYINSDGTIVWDRSTNTGYSNNIFGIARDDISRLNQVQSRSTTSDMLTMYMGTLSARNNNTSTVFTADKSHVMIGSNNQSIANNVVYEYLAGEVFASGPLATRLNYRTQLVYRTQITTAGSPGGSQTVNFQLNSLRPKFLLVSSDPNFAPGSTYVYEITNRTASDIIINNGDYISFCGFEPRPGGLTAYTLDLWVDGNHSTNSSWENLASSVYTLQRFATNAPIVRNSRLNFNREIFFGNVTSSKLRTTANYTITNGQAYYAFVVSENNGTGESTLISYNPTTTDANARRTSLRWLTGNSIRLNWNNALTTAPVTLTGTNNFGIASMNLVNTTNSTNRMYLSGTTNTAVPSTQQAIGVPLLVGNGNNNTTTGSNLSLNGSIQEIILMRGGSALLSPVEVARVHTYLGIKYGITVDSVGGNYIASDGTTTVWDRITNGGYNNNIFGIGRDDISGLYQKQSRSTSFPYLIMYITGSTLKTLNVENTGTLEDKQYFIVGSSGGTVVQRLSPTIDPGTEYQNGSILPDMLPLNISSPIYRAQWTGFTDDSVTVTMQPQQDFYYAQVSTDANFTPSNTKIYLVSQGGSVDVDFVGAYQFFRFVGFSPGPGGVMPGLSLWLRADDPAALVTSSGIAGSGRLANYTAIAGEDPNNIPAVQSWTDLVRQQTFVQSTSTDSRAPVLRPNAPEMNYHPAVFFWFWANNDTGQQRAYLWNAGGILNVAQPAAHSAIFVVNNRFLAGHANWIYTMLFSSAGITGGNNYDGPGYGLNRTAITGGYAGRGRLRSNNSNDTAGDGAAVGTQNLFRPDATTILSYYPRLNGNANNGVTTLFRFNAVEESQTSLYRNSADMRLPSQLGTGYGPNRTINGVMSEAILFDRELDLDEKIKVESYLGLRYSVTLYPTNTTYNRFDYTLSNDTIIWQGNVDVTDPVYGKYAIFYNNIAAIIRDDAARLNNRHTHSTNVGSLLHLGIAGTELRDDASTVGYWDYNMEAVIFGDDANIDYSPNNSDCGDFDYRFNRIWYVHKKTRDDRPISLLVGAQDNRLLSIGNDANTTDYYSQLTAANDIFLIVANSPDSIVNGGYIAVLPMTLIDGEYQCNYVFTEEDTYLTFGYRPNSTGCYSPEEAQFAGSKTFQWTQYTSRTNRLNTAGLTIPTPALPAVDLGDNISVTSTSLVYPSGVRATTGYPRASNAPGRGGLEVRRAGGAVEQDIVITINFNYPVMPSFSISGIDDYRYTSYDEVSITGFCSGNPYYPLLTAANRTPSYRISGNTATANQRSRLAGNNKSGTVDIEFQGAVEQIEIRYRLKNRVRGTQRIFISPITLHATFPPPPINEDGLGFTKYVSETEVTSCDPVSYTFHIINTNCDDKYVSFLDELDPNMTWEFESLALDTINNLYNPSLRVNDYENISILEIDSLLIPGTSEIKIKATAVFDPEIPTGEYNNRASITYDRYTTLLGELQSVDRVTLEKETSVFVQWQERVEDVIVEILSERTYSPNSEIEITYKITNFNDPITDVFMDIDFNEGFYYIPSSFLYYTDDPEAVPAAGDPTFVTDGAEPNANYLSIAGAPDASVGFTLPSGVIYIRFLIQTPILADIQDELGQDGQPTGRKEPLLITHDFFSDMDDPCIIESMSRMSGVRELPFATITHIRTNRNESLQIKK